jgi:hypothetical protein
VWERGIEGVRVPATPASPRRIIANLLAEDDLERLFHPGDRRFRLRRPPAASVLRNVSRLAPRLAVFARPGDRLWTPAPLDPADLIPGLPVPVLESGPLNRLPPIAETLAWCETPEVVALRTRPRPFAPSDDMPLHEQVWRLPVASPEVVARVHHRSFALRLAEDLGCALPGARMVDGLAELDRILAERSAPASWILKAPFSASGRSRYIERDGPLLTNPKFRRTVENLFERHGSLLFEPWLDRVADWGCAALLTESEMRIVSIHGQRVDIKGQFTGIDPDASGLPDRDRARLKEVAAEVGTALRRAGYTGPFGIDAWHWRRPDGSITFHPLGEINARMTFGLVQRALVQREAERSG